MMVAKAYEALTDPAAKDNYEKYGNSDGKQSLQVSGAGPVPHHPPPPSLLTARVTAASSYRRYDAHAIKATPDPNRPPLPLCLTIESDRSARIGRGGGSKLLRYGGTLGGRLPYSTTATTNTSTNTNANATIDCAV